MNNNSSYLIFTFNKLEYAVPTLTVQEIFLLPAITITPELPPDIIGVINLRGDIIPIMDLNRRFGYADQEYQLDDNIVILNWENIKVGIIVNQVQEIKYISSDEITSELSHDQYFDTAAPERFIGGFAQYQEQIITLLKIDSILRYVEQQDLPDLENVTQQEQPIPKIPVFCSYLTVLEQQILQKRADHLRQITFKQDLSSVQPLAVVKFSEEFLAIDLKLVREFTNITRVTPIPCTPPHIIGNINLRGEILTLIDLSCFLQLNTSGVRQRKTTMVVKIDDILAGITIDSVHDVILLDPQTIQEVPTSHVVNQDYLKGVAPYQDKMMSILNLSAIMRDGKLIVDEVA